MGQALHQMCLYFIAQLNEKSRADYRFTPSFHIIPQSTANSLHEKTPGNANGEAVPFNELV